MNSTPPAAKNAGYDFLIKLMLIGDSGLASLPFRPGFRAIGKPNLERRLWSSRTGTTSLVIQNETVQVLGKARFY